MSTTLLLVWTSLAVGLIDEAGNVANVFYAGLLVAGFLAAVVVRFRSREMASVMTGMAAGQLTVAALAQALGWAPLWALDVVFAGLWLASAWLFRRAAGGAHS